MIQPAYTTGIVRMTAGSAVVRGEGTAWVLGLVNGGLLTFGGRAIPIASVESNTQLTLAYPSPAAFEGIYAIDLGRADAASAIVANRRLAELLAGLATISPFGSQLTAAETAAQVRGLIETLALDGSNEMSGQLRVSGVERGVEVSRATHVEIAWHVVGVVRKILRVDGTAWRFRDQGGDETHRLHHDGSIWSKQFGDLLAALNARLSLSGGAMSGPLTLARATAKNLVALPVTFADNSGLYYGNFSGVLSITEHNNGNTAIFICGNGNVVLLGQTGTSFQVGIPASGGPSRVGCFYDQGSNGYAFWNRRGGPVQVSILSIEQRPAA